MTGLQSFILAMIATPIAKLRRADPVKLAAKYEISGEAAFSLRHWCAGS